MLDDASSASLGQLAYSRMPQPGSDEYLASAYGVTLLTSEVGTSQSLGGDYNLPQPARPLFYVSELERERNEHVEKVTK